MRKIYKSEALAAVHEMMAGLNEAGAIDLPTLRGFDEAALASPTPLPPDDIKPNFEAGGEPGSLDIPGVCP